MDTKQVSINFGNAANFTLEARELLRDMAEKAEAGLPKPLRWTAEFSYKDRWLNRPLSEEEIFDMEYNLLLIGRASDGSYQTLPIEGLEVVINPRLVPVSHDGEHYNRTTPEIDTREGAIKKRRALIRHLQNMLPVEL